MNSFRLVPGRQIISAFAIFQSVTIVRGSNVRIRGISSNTITGWGSIPSQNVQSQLKIANLFCFDVDSTLIQSESIDELADFLGVGDQVQKITADAMGGSLNFTVALRQRLDLMRPSESDILRFQEKHPFVLTDGVRIRFMKLAMARKPLIPESVCF
jgi:hypothetical protein